jgi:hypothetical protein
LLPDRDKIANADYHFVNTGSYEELDAWVAGVIDELVAGG